MSRRTKTRILTASVLVSVFGAGVLLGLAADANLIATPSVAAEAPVVEEETSEPERQPMYAQVGPDSAQSVEIDSLVQLHRARMAALNEEFQAAFDPRYRAIVEETREAIKGVFTEEQATRYQALIEERDRQRAEEESNGAGGSEER